MGMLFDNVKMLPSSKRPRDIIDLIPKHPNEMLPKLVSSTIARWIGNDKCPD